MVIDHVIDSLEVGGAEAVVAALCRIQRGAGHVVTVHCLAAKGVIGEGLEAEGVSVLIHGPARRPVVVWRLYRSFRKRRPTVVHCHNKTATVHAAAAARLAGVAAVVSTRHGLAPLPYRFRKEFKFWMTAVLFCQRVVAVCETARRNMTLGARAVSHKVVTIRNGAYPSGSAQDEVISKQGFTLVSVGRLAPPKTYSTLLESVALAKQHVSDLRLWIIGDGEDSSSLKHLSSELGLNDVVSFLGERTDVGRWLRRADVFVLSSASEGLPISVLEAMAAGLPALVTDVGGMSEVVSLSRAGQIVPPGNAQAMAAAIVEFAERRDQLDELGRRARMCYQQHFTPERMAEDYHDLYRLCLGSKMAV